MLDPIPPANRSVDGSPDHAGCAITTQDEAIWTPGFDRSLES